MGSKEKKKEFRERKKKKEERKKCTYVEAKDLLDMVVGLTVAPLFLLLCMLRALFLALVATTVFLAFMIVSIILWYLLARSLSVSLRVFVCRAPSRAVWKRNRTNRSLFSSLLFSLSLASGSGKDRQTG